MAAEAPSPLAMLLLRDRAFASDQRLTNYAIHRLSLWTVRRTPLEKLAGYPDRCRRADTELLERAPGHPRPPASRACHLANRPRRMVRFPARRDLAYLSAAPWLDRLSPQAGRELACEHRCSPGLAAILIRLLRHATRYALGRSCWLPRAAGEPRDLPCPPARAWSVLLATAGTGGRPPSGLLARLRVLWIGH